VTDTSDQTIARSAPDGPENILHGAIQALDAVLKFAFNFRADADLRVIAGVRIGGGAQFGVGARVGIGVRA